MAEERLDLTAQGQVRYRLKTPHRDATTDIVLKPLDFVARLAALVPPPHRSRATRDLCRHSDSIGAILRRRLRNYAIAAWGNSGGNFAIAQTSR
jgi:hypothetical protein